MNTFITGLNDLLKKIERCMIPAITAGIGFLTIGSAILTIIALIPAKGISYGENILVAALFFSMTVMFELLLSSLVGWLAAEYQKKIQ